MKPEPGGELACRAYNYHFSVDGSEIERGIISYYASRALTLAVTVESWLHTMNDLSEADLERELITDFHKPSLQIIGNSNTRILGNPVSDNSDI